MNRFALLAVALAVPAAVAFATPKPADAAVIVTMHVPTVYVNLGGPTVVDHDRDDRVADRDDRYDHDRRYDRDARIAAIRHEQEERYERERAEAMRHYEGRRGIGHAWGHDRDGRR
ncbi:MAG TPA: hypothetical protein V6D47_04540 [Oscillatoriaceae cyanobacterium]